MLLVSRSSFGMLKIIMASEKLPLVLVALDTNFAHAREILGKIETYDRHEVGVQIRSSLLRACGNEIIRIARECGRYVGANTGIIDAPAKQAADIKNWLFTESSFDGSVLYRPDAITVAPPTTAPAVEQLRPSIEEATAAKVAVIGTPVVHDHFKGDIDWLADAARKADNHAHKAGFTALEVVYGALGDFTSNRNDGTEQLIISKISDYQPDMQLAARHVFENGGTSLLLGASIVAAADPREPIDAILDIAGKTL